ncbi:MAG TPA: DUF1974 domain-containing protein, partial [Gammaproteobacteria bacterium]|nr:DUF1974 domain-containing protein [Gammaproteobacteria bacterium]
LILGGELKRKEKLSGRLADALSNMYLITAVLKHYEDQGSKSDDLPLLEWACEDSLYNVQEALKSVMRNFPVPFVGGLLNMVIFPLTKPYGGANDKLGHKIARLLLSPSAVRDRLTHDIYVTEDPDDAVGRLEHALKKVIEAEDAERKFRDAIRIGLVTSQDYDSAVEEAIQQSIIDQNEADKILSAHEATLNAISVDEFSPKGWKPQ